MLSVAVYLVDAAVEHWLENRMHTYLSNEIAELRFQVVMTVQWENKITSVRSETEDEEHERCNWGEMRSRGDNS